MKMCHIHWVEPSYLSPCTDFATDEEEFIKDEILHGFEPIIWTMQDLLTKLESIVYSPQCQEFMTKDQTHMLYLVTNQGIQFQQKI